MGVKKNNSKLPDVAWGAVPKNNQKDSRPEAPLDVKLKKWLRNHMLLSITVSMVLLSWGLVTFLSRGRALSNWAAAEGYSYTEGHNYDLFKTTLKGFRLPGGDKATTRYAAHVMRGTSPAGNNVTVFDMYYSSVGKYDDGDTYVDENEFTVLAFSIPGHSFTPLKIWPRKYLTSKSVDEAPTSAGTAATGTVAAAGGETTAGGGGFDEAKETYLEYRTRTKKEKKAQANAPKASPQRHIL